MANHLRVTKKAGRLTAVGALPLAVAITYAGMASAAPQPGTTTPPQPGATTPAQPGVTGPLIAPENSPAVQSDQAAPATDYGTQRSVPKQRYAAPLDLGKLHGPVPVRPVAPILPPANTIRIGEFQTPTPQWLPPEVRDTINGSASQAEAQVSTFARSVGIAPNRSDRIAGTAAVGALGGAALAGIPAAVPGAVVGGVIGGVAGGVIAAVIAVPYLPILPISVPQIIAGVAIGAAVGGVVGAAVTGVVPAVAGGVVGGLLGGAVGSGT